MSVSITEYHRPGTLEEAVSLLARGGGKLQPLAGGTALTLLKGRLEIGVVDLWRIGLDKIRTQDGRIEIEAMVTIEQMRRDPATKAYAGGVLAEACENLASTPLRNLITLGGNIVQVHPWSDLPPLILAIGADVVLQSMESTRIVKADSFFGERPRSILTPGELVKAVSFPNIEPGQTIQFTKFRTNQFDYSLVTVASNVTIRAGLIESARIVTGGLGAGPSRIQEAETALVGQALTPALIDRAGGIARNSVKPARDMRTSAEFKKEVVSVLLRRHLTAIHPDKVAR